MYRATGGSGNLGKRHVSIRGVLNGGMYRKTHLYQRCFKWWYV